MNQRDVDEDGDVLSGMRRELVRFVERRVESRDAAEDIVQDVLERLSRVGMAEVRDPREWLFRAARNATVDHYRRRRRSTSWVEAQHWEEAQHWAGESAADESETVMRELATCLRPLLGRLDQKYRRAILLVDLEGRTHRDAAVEEGVSTAGMKSRVQRGRVKLGETLVACCGARFGDAGWTTRSGSRTGQARDRDHPVGCCGDGDGAC